LEINKNKETPHCGTKPKKIAFGIGTSQVRDVLATQTLAMNKLKVRQIWCDNKLSKGVYAKDLVLHIINKLGVKAGVGLHMNSQDLRYMNYQWKKG